MAWQKYGSLVRYRVVTVSVIKKRKNINILIFMKRSFCFSFLIRISIVLDWTHLFLKACSSISSGVTSLCMLPVDVAGVYVFLLGRQGLNILPSGVMLSVVTFSRLLASAFWICCRSNGYFPCSFGEFSEPPSYGLRIVWTRDWLGSDALCKQTVFVVVWCRSEYSRRFSSVSSVHPPWHEIPSSEWLTGFHR